MSIDVKMKGCCSSCGGRCTSVFRDVAANKLSNLESSLLCRACEKRERYLRKLVYRLVAALLLLSVIITIYLNLNLK